MSIGFSNFIDRYELIKRLSIIGFIIGFTVHLATFFYNFEMMWFIYAMVFTFFIILFWGTIHKGELNGSLTSPTFFINKAIPNWLMVFFTILFIYAFLQTIIYLFGIGAEGNPEMLDGKYIISSHGEFIRSISETEYHYRKMRETRFFSTPCMILYLGLYVFFMPEDRFKNKASL